MKNVNLWIINGSPRNVNSCPQEISKSQRLAEYMANVARRLPNVKVVLTHLYNYRLGPCKGCVSTVMSLCHYPCDCYPDRNYPDDPMREFYKIGEQADAILFVTPNYWDGPSGLLKLFLDRLVCVDGGNTNPQGNGKDPKAERKYMESGRFKPVKHWAGKVAGILSVSNASTGATDAIANQMNWMGLWVPPYCIQWLLVGAGEQYHHHHKALDKDECAWETANKLVRNLVDAARIIGGKKLESVRSDCLI